MSLDPELLAAARAAAAALERGEAAVARLREDYRASLRALNAAGVSLRQIAAALGLSHQRVHQLVGAAAVATGRPAESRACCLCGEADDGGGPVCSSCRAAGRSLLAGDGAGEGGRLRLVRRHQRPRCASCVRRPEAGEAFLAGPFGAVCPQCLDGKSADQ